MNILHSIGAWVATIGLFIAGLFGYAPTVEDTLGVALPSGTADFESSLAVGISDSATSMTLVSNSIRGGGSLSGYECFTIDEGSAQEEYVCGTASSTSVTGLERGISPADGITETAGLKFAHRRGASVKITDFPLIQRIKSQNAGVETYDSVLSYASGVTPTGGSELVDVEYLTSVVTGTSTLSYNKIIVNGTAGETLTTGNIVYLNASDSRWYKADNDISSTYVDQTLGIAQGNGTAGNNVQGGILTYGLDSTQKAMTGGQYIFLSATAGATSTATTSQVLGKAISATTMFFDQNLIDSSVYVPTTFTSTTTFNGTTTFTGYVSGIGTASATVFTTTGTSTYTKSTNINLKYVVVEVVGGGGGGGALTEDSAGGGAGGYAKKYYVANTLGATSSVVVGVGGGTNTNGGSSIFASTVIANGGAPGGYYKSPGIGGTATGGTINMRGGPGSSSTNVDGANNENGSGGNSVFGGGGVGTYNGTSDGAANTGGGGAGRSSGGSGIVIITEYF